MTKQFPESIVFAIVAHSEKFIRLEDSAFRGSFHGAIHCSLEAVRHANNALVLALAIAQDICPVCGDHCYDDIQLYGMCAECHDQQAKAHVCEHCGGQGEVQVHITGKSWDSNDPGAWKPQRCEHCEGTGKQ